MSLLKITTTPIEYEIKIERAKLRAKENDPQDLQDYEEQARQQYQSRARVQRQIKSQNAAQLNESTKSTQSFENAARMRTAGRAVATAASELVSNSIGSTSAEAAQQTAGVETTADKQISFSSALSTNDFAIDDDMFVDSVPLTSLSSNMQQEWTAAKNDMEFVPGRFQMDIIQLPKVSIEYTGGIQYFPKSADPNFKKPE